MAVDDMAAGRGFDHGTYIMSPNQTVAFRLCRSICRGRQFIYGMQLGCADSLWHAGPQLLLKLLGLCCARFYGPYNPRSFLCARVQN